MRIFFSGDREKGALDPNFRGWGSAAGPVKVSPRFLLGRAMSPRIRAPSGHGGTDYPHLIFVTGPPRGRPFGGGGRNRSDRRRRKLVNNSGTECCYSDKIKIKL